MASGKALGAFLAAALASQAFAKDLDRAKLDEARSNVAEAGLLERQFAAGRVTEAYADALRQDLRKSLVKLKKEPPLASAMRAALDAIDRHDGEALSALADQLATKERALGRTG